MATVEIIPSRRWRHTSGRTASIYGAAPYVNDAAAEGWTIEESGFTTRNPDGTIGCGRVPFETREEAQAWIDARPRFRGMSPD